MEAKIIQNKKTQRVYRKKRHNNNLRIKKNQRNCDLNVNVLHLSTFS